MNETKMIEYDEPKRERLRKAYDDAREKHAETFEFEGDTYLVQYAMYLLEFLDTFDEAGQKRRAES